MNPVYAILPAATRSDETIKLLEGQQTTIREIVRSCLDQTERLLSIPRTSRHSFIGPISLLFTELKTAVEVHERSYAEFSNAIPSNNKLKLEENLQLLVLTLQIAVSLFDLVQHK